MVARLHGLVTPGRITQVVAQLPAQGPLDQRFLQRHRHVLDRLGRGRALRDLVKQILRDLGQRRRSLGDRGILQLRLAGHTCS